MTANRDRVVGVRVTARERELIRHAADCAQTALSDWVRSTLIAAALREPPAEQRRN